ncbi:MAG: restriction endonuclease subunit S [Gammaproteobacteria bacterium]|nr:restriction endonuclease subunit S [Gammaproteobacteria bacterium]
MKLETFFGKFDQFVDAPDAVPKMRELVLELAVNGSLSERLACDQDDDAWLEFIAELDHRLSSHDPASPPPFEIPETWRWVCLDNLGKTKVRNDIADGTRVSFVPMALIPAGYGLAAQSEERTWSEVKKAFTHFADGDVVMAKITPCFENAKSAVMRKLVNGIGAGTTELHVFRQSTEVIVPEFALIYLKTQGFITRGESRMTGSAGQKRVPHSYFAGSPFPLPPPAEQKRIVAKVDELMALCDRLEAQQQEGATRHAALARASLTRFADAPTPANLEFLFHDSFDIAPADLRKSILTLAVQGLLLPHDPESAGWETRKLKEVTTKIGSGSTPSGGRDSYQESGVPLIRSMNVHFGGFVRHGLAFLNEEQAEKLRNVTVQADDVLLNITGASIGRVTTAPNDMEGARVNQHVCIVRPSAAVLPSFLELFLASPVVQDLIDDVQVGATREALTKAMIEQFDIPLPPLAEQRRIVAKLEQLMALVDALETQLAASRATAAKLMEALVAELTSPT